MKTNNQILSDARPKSNYPTWVDLMAIIGVLIVASGVCGVIMMLLTSTGTASKEFSLFICYVVQFGAVIAFALWQKWRRGGERPLINLSFKGANPAIILWGVILTVAMTLLVEPIVNLFPDMYLEKLNDMIGTGGWAMLTTIVCAPILEEILFRGIIQNSITQRLGSFRGVIITSAIFGAIHVIPPQAINAFFVSLVIGYIYVKSGSLIAVIAIHAINNAIAYIGMVVNDGKTESTKEMIGNDKIYHIVYAIAIVIFLIGVINVVKGLRNAKNKKLNDQASEIDNNLPE